MAKHSAEKRANSAAAPVGDINLNWRTSSPKAAALLDVIVGTSGTEPPSPRPPHWHRAADAEPLDDMPVLVAITGEAEVGHTFAIGHFDGRSWHLQGQPRPAKFRIWWMPLPTPPPGPYDAFNEVAR